MERFEKENSPLNDDYNSEEDTKSHKKNNLTEKNFFWKMYKKKMTTIL